MLTVHTLIRYIHYNIIGNQNNTVIDKLRLI
jgi:hypothetical protein